MRKFIQVQKHSNHELVYSNCNHWYDQQQWEPSNANQAMQTKQWETSNGKQAMGTKHLVLFSDSWLGLLEGKLRVWGGHEIWHNVNNAWASLGVYTAAASSWGVRLREKMFCEMIGGRGEVLQCTESLPHYIINSGKSYHKSHELAPVEKHAWHALSFSYFIIADLLYSTFGVCSGNALFCTWMVGISLWLQNNQFQRVQGNMLYTRHLKFATP